VTQLPAHREARAVIAVPLPGPSASEHSPDLPLAFVWGVVRRHWLVILACTMLAAGVAATYALTATPIYQGVASLRIDDKQNNLPDIFRALGGDGEVFTEVEVLKSRSLVEDATKMLGLQLTLRKPERVSRKVIFQTLSIADSVIPGSYSLRRAGEGGYLLTGPGIAGQQAISVGEPGNLGGLGFVLAPSAARYSVIEFEVEPLSEAIIRVRKEVGVTQPNREAKVVTLSYRDSDRELAYQVPNMIAARFIVRRQEIQKSAARSTVAFLRTQIDTLARQLGASEQTLKRYREREQVVNPTVEGSTQVERMIQIQSERAAVEAERASLAALLAEVETSHRRAPADPSPYRRLVSFPTLLRNQAATELLKSLAEVETRQAELLARRTPADPEVEALEGRVRDLEEQLRSVAVTYLTGLTNQVSSMDEAISTFDQQLSRVPQRELEFAQLQRKPKVLEEVYTLLQTRLKEAEIAQAVEDGSVQLVDPAARPLEPVAPRKRTAIALGVLFGILLGMGVAFLIEYFDKSVHTRADVADATGLSVLGLIPRIPTRGKEPALISEPSRAARPTMPTPPADQPDPSPPRGDPRNFTFLRPAHEAHAPVTSRGEEGGEADSAAAGQRDHRVAISGIGTAIAEAYGSLQTNLLHARMDEAVQTVVFTSAQPGEGKSTIAVNLALSLTHRGVRVLLIDADLRRGTIQSLFHVPRTPGLTDVIRGKVRLEEACRSVWVDEGGVLSYLTTGTLPSNPSAVLASRETRLFLESLRAQYDIIIIDSPPVNLMTDAALLGANSDGVVIVARAGVTHSTALAYAMEQLGHVRARVLGVVLNDVDFHRDASYDASYRYHNYSNTAPENGR
jgi:polysaccharide biosynthesis transport protein